MKKLKCLFLTLFFIISYGLFSQSALPAESNNFLQIANAPASGDDDEFMVVFFEVPDTVTGPIFFAVWDPGLDGEESNADPDWGNTDDWTFSLLGGSGTLTAADAKKYSYALGGTPYTGSIIDTISGTGSGNVNEQPGQVSDGQWVYFAGVMPSQGEKIGNTYYFKVVAESGGGDKNGFRLDASYDNTSTTSTTGISSIRSFAYSWTLALLDRVGNTWDIYPFVPESAIGNLEVNLFDFDFGEQTRTYNKDGSEVTLEFPSYMEGEGYPGGNNGVSTSAFSVTGQTNGTWRVEVTEDTEPAFIVNTSVVYFTGSNPAENLRAYAAPYIPPAPDHVVITPVSKVGQKGVPHYFTAQIVDSSGAAVPYVRNLRIETSPAVSSINGGTIDVTTDSEGQVSFYIQENALDGPITISILSDGTNGTSRIPSSGTLGVNETASLTLNPAGEEPPTISSAINTAFTEGSAQDLPIITISDTLDININSTNDIYIRIPSTLNAVFDTGVLPTLDDSAGGAYINTTPTFIDNKTLEIRIATTLPAGEWISVGDGTALRLTSVNTESSGYLEMSYSGPGGPWDVIDDKQIIIRSPLTTWTAGAGSWSVAGNWSSGVPGSPSVSALITGITAEVSLDVDAPDVDSLTITEGSKLLLDASGTYGAPVVNGNFINDGILSIGGNRVVASSPWIPTDRGTIEYTGTTTALGGGANYYNLNIDGSVTLDRDIVVYGDLTINTGGSLNANGWKVTVYGDWDNSNGGTFTAGTGEIVFKGSGSSTIKGSTSFNDLTCTTGGKTIVFTAGTTQTTTGVLTLKGTSSQNLILQSSTAAQYNITPVAGSSVVEFIDVAYSNFTADTDAYYSVDSGSNTINDASSLAFKGTYKVWTGGASTTNWADNLNWSPPTAPSPTEAAIIGISGTGFYPRLVGPRTVESLTVEGLASIDLNGNQLTVTKDVFVDGTLDMSVASSGISAVDLISTGTITCGLTSTISLSGNMDISGTYANPSNSTITLSGTGKSITSTVPVGNIVIDGTISNSGNLDINGNFTINATKAFTATGSSLITVTGDWTNNNGATGFVANNSTVEFDSTITSHTISGNTTFYNLKLDASTAAAQVTLSFQGLSTQTIDTGGLLTLRGKSGQELILTSTDTNLWVMDMVSAVAPVVDYLNVSYADAGTRDINPTNSTAGTGNDTTTPMWDLSTYFTWLGTHATNPDLWSEPTNWSPNGIPDNVAFHYVTIPTGAPAYPKLTASVSVRDIEIQASSSLDVVGFDLTIGGTITNNGKLFRTGVSGQNVSKIDTNALNTGTIVYTGAAAGEIQDYSPNNYNNLEIADGTKTALANLTVNKTLKLTLATSVLASAGFNVDINTGDVTGLGSVDSTGGTFTLTNGTINFKGTYSTVSIDTGSTANSLNDALTVGAGGITGAGTLASGSSTITLTGLWDIAAFTEGTSTVRVGSTQTIAATADHQFHNLLIEGTTTLTPSANIIVLNDITIDAGNTLALGTNNLDLYRHRTANTGSITGTGTVYWKGTILDAAVVPFNFDTLIQDLVFSNNVTLGAHLTVLTAGNITFSGTVDGDGVNDNSLVVTTTTGIPGKDITFSAAIGATTPPGVGAAAVALELTGKNINLTDAPITSAEAIIFSGLVNISTVAGSTAIQTTGTTKDITFNGNATTNKPLSCISTGDIILNAYVAASPTTSALTLQAEGNIVDGTAPSETALVIADNITLRSATAGSIGSAAADGDIDVDCTTLVEASAAAGGVFLNQVGDRDLNITYVTATNGDIVVSNEALTPANQDIIINSDVGPTRGVMGDIDSNSVTIITANGAIQALNATSDLEIRAFQLTLSSGSFSGSRTNVLNINVVNQFDVTTASDLWVYDTSGTFPINNVTATGRATIRSAGDITRFGTGVITADRLQLATIGATKHIGVTGAATNITTNVNFLEASSTGNVFVTDQNALTIGAYTIADGDDIVGVVAAGEISLATSGNTALVVNEAISSSGDAPITLNSGTAVITLNSNVSFTNAIVSDLKDLTFSSPVQLGGGTYTIETTSPATVDLDVTFSSTVDNAGNLILNSGIGYIDFNGVIGGTTAITSLTVGNALRADFSGVGIAADGITGNFSVTTLATDGIILLEGTDYRVTGSMSFTGGNKTAPADKSGLLIELQHLDTTISSANFTVDPSTVSYIYGVTSNKFLQFLSPATVTFGGDLHISATDKKIRANTKILAKSLVVYAARLEMENGFSLECINDLVLLGAGYNTVDAETGESIFEYNSPYRTNPAWDLADPNTAVLSGTILGYTIVTSANYKAEFKDINTTDAYIKIGKNFYNNGCNMKGSEIWYLDIPDTNNALTAFAEAYNMEIKNSDNNIGNTYPIAASENVNKSGLADDWYITQPELDTTVTGIHTVYDDVIRVFLVSGNFENSNNEIAKAMASGAIGVNNNGITGANLTAYKDALCTTLTSAGPLTDLSEFYIKVGGGAANRWNTDATGASAGTGTDRGRTGVTPANRTTIPNLDINKNTATVYFTLRDDKQNRIKHTVGAGRITAVRDLCKPVITSIEASRHPAGTAETYDAHNYFLVSYSEDVTYSFSSGNIPIGTKNVESRTVILNTSGEQLGEMTQAGPDVKVAGLFTYPGNFVSGSFGAYTNTNALYQISARQLQIDVVGFKDTTVTPNTWFGYLGDTSQNITNYTKITNPSVTFIDNDFEGALATLQATHAGDPALTAQLSTTPIAPTILATIDITDANSNVLEDSTSTYDSYYNSLTISGTGWDVFPPFFPELDTQANNYEIFFHDIDADGKTDRFEVNILDNHIMQSLWSNSEALITNNGWQAGVAAPGIQTLPEPLVNTGIRDLDWGNALTELKGFTIGKEGDPTLSSNFITSGTTDVNIGFVSGLLPPAVSVVNTTDDNYFSVDFDSTPLGVDRWVEKDPMQLEYSSAVGKITDLAGNIMPSTSGRIYAFQWISPEITLALAAVGSKKIYVRFSKPVYDGGSDLLPTSFEIFKDDGVTQFGISEVNSLDGTTGDSEYYIKLTTALTANDIVNGTLAALSVTDNYSQPVAAAARRISDLGIGVVTPISAEDTIHRDSDIHSTGSLKVFDGTGKLFPEKELTISARIEANNHTNYTMKLLYEISPDLSAGFDYDTTDNVYNSKLWLKDGVSLPGVFEFVGLGLQGHIGDPVNSTNLRVYTIPDTTPGLENGNNFQFIYELDTPHGLLYCVDLDGTNELVNLEPFEISLQNVREQRGGVTIINNVINPLAGGKTTIFVDQDKPGKSTVVIFSLDGNMVRKIQSGRKAAGRHEYSWDGRNESGVAVARGVYFVKVVAPGINESRKVMIVK